jgi:hypothetical protein
MNFLATKLIFNMLIKIRLTIIQNVYEIFLCLQIQMQLKPKQIDDVITIDRK